MGRVEDYPATRTSAATRAELTPVQLRVLDELMARGRPRPRFAPALAEDLRGRLEDAIAPLLGDATSDAVGDDGPLWVTKGALSEVHACEAHHLDQVDQGFTWNAGNARGTVAHRAVELTLSSRRPAAPLELVDRALDSLGADDPRGVLRPWLADATDVEVADLRAGANDAVAKFIECWPPLKPAWSPRTETKIGVDLCGDRVVLRGKVDLVLGQARGDEARVLVVDLKTGRAYPSHLDDLRYYALVQTLRVGVPPFRVASYYLDTATFHHEDVTVDTLAIAMRRTVDGVAKLVELAGGREPDITPGPQCGWCRLAPRCQGPEQWRRSRGEDDGG